MMSAGSFTAHLRSYFAKKQGSPIHPKNCVVYTLEDLEEAFGQSIGGAMVDDDNSDDDFRGYSGEPGHSDDPKANKSVDHSKNGPYPKTSKGKKRVSGTSDFGQRQLPEDQQDTVVVVPSGRDQR